MIFLTPMVKKASKAVTNNKFKKLSLAVGLSCTLISQQALALTLSSEPNQDSVHIFQPLDIKIEIIDKDNEVLLDDISVNMASQRSFERLGLERNFFLSKLKIKKDETKEGVKFLHITSSELVKEPFLMFLLEVSWPNGRLFKDYTLLFDAPLTQKIDAKPLIKLTRNGDDAKIKNTQAKNLNNSNFKVNNSENSQYLVKDTDTLWGIAVNTKPQEGITVQQMMLSLQDKNPKAFVNNNINILKSGVLLTIPTPDEVLVRSQAQANDEVYSQSNNTSKSIIDDPSAGALKPQPEIIDSVNIDKKNNEENVGSEKINKPQLRLVTADNSLLDGQSVSGSPDAVIDSLEDDLAIALDQVEKEQRDNAEKINTISELEVQNETLNRILDLKSQELAELQRQFEEQVASEENIAELSDIDLLNDATKPAEVIKPKDESLAEVDDLIGFVEVDEKNATLEVATQVEVEEAQENSVIDDAVEVDENLESNNMFFDYVNDAKKWLIKSPLNIAIAAVSGLLFIILLLSLFSRNRKKDSNDEIDESVHINEVNLSENLDDDLLSDIDLDSDEFGGFDEHDTLEDTDALEEAQKSIGYGDLNQAITILEMGYQINSDREDYVIKLLDLYGKTEQNDKFSDLEARASINATNSLLAQIEALRGQYNTESNGDVIIEDELQAIDLDFLDIDLGLDDLENNNSLEIDLNESSMAVGDNLLDTNVESDDLLLDFAAEAEDDFEISLDDLAEDVDIDFTREDGLIEIELDDIVLDSKDEHKPNETNSVQDFEFSLDELDSEIAQLDAQFSADELLELDDKSVALDLSEADVPTMTAQDIELESELGEEIDFMGDSDENSTKLNLAKAFVEMGDNDSAKEMLEEIIEEGDDAQKAEAQLMINSL